MLSILFTFIHNLRYQYKKKKSLPLFGFEERISNFLCTFWKERVVDFIFYFYKLGQKLFQHEYFFFKICRLKLFLLCKGMSWLIDSDQIAIIYISRMKWVMWLLYTTYSRCKEVLYFGYKMLMCLYVYTCYKANSNRNSIFYAVVAR